MPDRPTTSTRPSQTGFDTYSPDYYGGQHHSTYPRKLDFDQAPATMGPIDTVQVDHRHQYSGATAVAPRKSLNTRAEDYLPVDRDRHTGSNAQRRSKTYQDDYKPMSIWEHEGFQSRNQDVSRAPRHGDFARDEHDPLSRWERESRAAGPWDGIGAVCGADSARGEVGGPSTADRDSICVTCGGSGRLVNR